MLNAKQIVDEGLLLLEHTQGKPAQVGYDLSLKAVQKIGTRIGYNIFNDNAVGKVLKNKTELTKYTPKSTIMLDGVEGWLLHEGVYDITFNEGCKIPDNRVAFIKQRSSMWRNGTLINSPVFKSRHRPSAVSPSEIGPNFVLINRRTSIPTAAISRRIM